MKAVEVSDLELPRDAEGHGYLDFLASSRLSIGLALWPAEGVDRQRPHAEDEIYYVIAGRGRLTVAGEERGVQSGSLILVTAGVEHRFHDITEDLRVLVFWAPPHSPTG